MRSQPKLQEQAPVVYPTYAIAPGVTATFGFGDVLSLEGLDIRTTGFRLCLRREDWMVLLDLLLQQEKQCCEQEAQP